jgi:hypothetical protein
LGAFLSQPDGVQQTGCPCDGRVSSSERSKGIAMPDQSSSAGKPGSSKKPISPARNAIGLVVLLALVAAVWFQYSAWSAYNSAVNALASRTEDPEKGLLTAPEAETLLGKSADGPGSDFPDEGRTYTKKSYTWRGLKPYTLTAFYTKEKEPYLHHFKTEGAELPPEPLAPAPLPDAASTPPTTKTSIPAPAGPEASKPATDKASVPAPAGPEASKPATDKAPVPAPAAPGASKPATDKAPVPAPAPK